jgi:hypothetical protein
MANKDFKVKNGLDIQSPLPVTMGGTGQTSSANSLNALLPIQTDHLSKFLQTDGVNTAWAIPNYSEVAKDGVAYTGRKTLNLIGALIADDSGNNRTNVTIIGSPLDILDGGSYDSVAPYDGGYYDTISFTYSFDGGTP